MMCENIKRYLPRNNNSNAGSSVKNVLSERNDLLFSKADKGGVTIILDVKNYIEKVNEESNYQNYYKKRYDDPTQEHTKFISNTTGTFKRQQVLPKSISDNLKTTNIRTPHFYTTPQKKIYQKQKLNIVQYLQKTK